MSAVENKPHLPIKPSTVNMNQRFMYYQIYPIVNDLQKEVIM